MKLKNFLFLTLAAVALMLLNSCANFHGTTTSIWSGGLWLIPTGTFLGSAYSFYRAWKQSKSGSQIQDLEKGTQYSKENVPIYKIGAFIFGVALLIATVAIILIQYSNR